MYRLASIVEQGALDRLVSASVCQMSIQVPPSQLLAAVRRTAYDLVPAAVVVRLRAASSKLCCAALRTSLGHGNFFFKRTGLACAWAEYQICTPFLIRAGCRPERAILFMGFQILYRGKATQAHIPAESISD